MAAASSFIGAPFQHQGRNPESGLDCAGLVVATMLALGLDVSDEHGYGRVPHGNRITQALDRQACLYRIPARHAGPGDVLLLRFDGEPQHLAVRSSHGMIHAYERVGKVCEHRMSQAWATKIVRVYRMTRG